MIQIDDTPYANKLADAFYQKVLQKNIAYLKEHGKGPYEYNGRFADRVVPYLSAGYWLEYDDWVRTEIGGVHDMKEKTLFFATEEAACWFILRWA